MNKKINYNMGRTKYLFKLLLKWRPLIFNDTWDLDAVSGLTKWATVIHVFKMWALRLEKLKVLLEIPKLRGATPRADERTKGSFYSTAVISGTALLIKGIK